jgi:Nucleotidyl transferase of unknown function (DUF2204)
MTDLGDALLAFARLFDEMGVVYAVMGGLAARAYGIPRPTYDIDFIADISRAELLLFFDHCEALGVTIARRHRSGNIDHVSGMPHVVGQLNLKDRGIDIDIFLVDSLYQQEVIARRQREEVDGQVIWLVSPEDLVLLKLVADRKRDWSDVADVLFTQGQLDEDYLRHWAKELSVETQLEKSLADAKSQ